MVEETGNASTLVARTRRARQGYPRREGIGRQRRLAEGGRDAANDATAVCLAMLGLHGVDCRIEIITLHG
jgi:hypothetical protein